MVPLTKLTNIDTLVLTKIHTCYVKFPWLRDHRKSLIAPALHQKFMKGIYIQGVF